MLGFTLVIMYFYKGCFFYLDRKVFFLNSSRHFRFTFGLGVYTFEEIELMWTETGFQKNKKLFNKMFKNKKRVIVSQVTLFRILLDVLKCFIPKWVKHKWKLNLYNKSQITIYFEPLKCPFVAAKEKLTCMFVVKAYILHSSYVYTTVKGMWLTFFIKVNAARGTHNFNFFENTFPLFQNIQPTIEFYTFSLGSIHSNSKYLCQNILKYYRDMHRIG